jgi:hypothetical protein
MTGFERVHTVTDYYDGPVRGIADFQGCPHLYEAEWDDTADQYAATFLLSPLSEEVVRLMLEDWDIWLRWEAAFHEGRTTHATHPALPEDRPRHLELRTLLAAQAARLVGSVRARALFRPVGVERTGRIRSLEVQWEVL